MSEYRTFPNDFIYRTKSIMYSYSGKYGVTNLINCCLGLIVIPKQAFHHSIPNENTTDDIQAVGISKENITLLVDKKYGLRNIVRHIRNGIAHGNIDQRSENGEIVGLRIYDKDDATSPDNFSIEFTIDEFKNFAIVFSELFV